MCTPFPLHPYSLSLALTYGQLQVDINYCLARFQNVIIFINIIKLHVQYFAHNRNCFKKTYHLCQFISNFADMFRQLLIKFVLKYQKSQILSHFVVSLLAIAPWKPNWRFAFPYPACF